MNSVKPGDLIHRTVLTNDICLTNRYPSIREESFGAHIIKVRPVQSILYNLQVVDKLGADFDGDESQLYLFASPEDCTEAALLSSAHR